MPRTYRADPPVRWRVGQIVYVPTWRLEHPTPAEAALRRTLAVGRQSRSALAQWRRPVRRDIGPILDLERAQISAHVSAADAAAHFADAPDANGRRWAGIPLQPRAVEIARAFLDRTFMGDGSELE